MSQLVFDFVEGSREMKGLLGGKGANLAEMTNLGLPVPPGFTITTEACQAYLRSGHEPRGLAEEVSTDLSALEQTMGKRLGQSDDPLLVSVCSGAMFEPTGTSSAGTATTVPSRCTWTAHRAIHFDRRRR